jgi:hypothetical protein
MGGNRYDSKPCIILDKKCNCQIHLSSYVGKSKHVFVQDVDIFDLPKNILKDNMILNSA